MEMIQVESSQFNQIGFQPAEGEQPAKLRIQFNNGGLYEYSGEPVTQELFDRFQGAESKGKFFYAEIRNNPAIAYTKLS